MPVSAPRPEYPRPQMVRDAWLNLNGPWQFEIDSGLSGEEKGWQTGREFGREILVPFCPESKLSGIGQTDFMTCVWYRRTFRVPAEWTGKRVLLHFGAVDHQASVWVNGKLVGRHRGGYTPFCFEITSLLREGDNEIVVRAFDDVRSGVQPSGKQSQRLESHGCVYTRTTGIWQTVWLEAVSASFVKKIRILPDLDGSRLILRASVDGPCSRLELRATALADGRPVGRGSAAASWRAALIVIPLSEVRPWSPQDPFLYDLEVELVSGSAVVDRIVSYFGLRKVEIEGKAIRLNGKPVFQRLVLDQGFYPDGIYTAPNDEALRRDIELSQAVGFNGARLHEKVFEPRFLYWADRLGYLVWGEFPNWGVDLRKLEAKQSFINEWQEALERDLNHPSIIGWCPFNETSPGAAHTDLWLTGTLYDITRGIDPTRPVLDTSGYTHVRTDVYDCHDYDQNPETFRRRHEAFKSDDAAVWRNCPDHDAPYAGQPYFVSEYGGIWWNPGQTDGKAWGYGNRPRDHEEFYARYQALTEALLNHPKMCAFCYTQLYDIEQEVNGIYTYARQPKHDAARLRAINARVAAIEQR
jgi:beta-galactosidase/beta-glucuronidase